MKPIDGDIHGGGTSNCGTEESGIGDGGTAGIWRPICIETDPGFIDGAGVI